jgi:hypothetical protein
MIGGRVQHAATFAGRNKDADTLTQIKVGRANALYESGAPLSGLLEPAGGAVKSIGDGTVPISSAVWLATAGVSGTPTTSVGVHRPLAGTFAPQICGFLTDQACVAPPDQLAELLQTQRLVLTIHGRAQPHLIDGAGRGVGITPGTGALEAMLPGSEVALDADGGSVRVSAPVDGTYSLELSTEHEEEYRLGISYADGAVVQSREYVIFGHAGETRTLTLTVSSTAAERVVVSQDPGVVMGLEASPFAGAGGVLTTLLQWGAVTGAASYNVYEKPDGEPFFTLLKNVATTSTDAQVPWAGEEHSTRRVFTVTAVKADGTEGFIGDIVANDDRDGDGVVDWVEVQNGTNPDDPDSDHDGLTDGAESTLGTSPMTGDTDGDGHSDDAEKRGGSDPLDPASVPAVSGLWHSWFAVDTLETPYVGDFNGDRKADIITFTRQNPNAVGDVYVALSEGVRFGANTKWHDWFAISTAETVVIGDFDGDGKDDIATWLGETTRQVYVAKSTGTGMLPESVWLDGIGTDPTDVLYAGDANGDGVEDLICFARKQGKVFVALSDGVKFAPPSVWHSWFAVSTYERPGVGDVNGDGRVDIITFATDSPTAFGDVYVAVSDGVRFVDRNGQPDNSDKWHDWFAIRPTERFRIADLNADGREDFFTFLPLPWGQCYTALSEGLSMGANVLWSEQVLRDSRDLPFAGDVNGDGKADVIVFAQGEGKVYVSLAP